MTHPTPYLFISVVIALVLMCQVNPLIQRVYEITGWDSRSIFSWSALFMFALILDKELNSSSKWHTEGGSEEMFKYAFFSPHVESFSH